MSTDDSTEITHRGGGVVGEDGGEYREEELFLSADEPTEVEHGESAGIQEVVEVVDDLMAEDDSQNEETEADEDEWSRAEQELEKLRAELEEVKREREANHAMMIRKAADLENYRKRATRERDELKRFGHEKLAKELLLVLDNMQRAESAFIPDASNEAIMNGVKMIHNSLVEGLKKFGIEGFVSVGEPFDPQRHEAIQQVETSEYETGTVIEEFQKGYMIYEKLLRVALVAVAKRV